MFRLPRFAGLLLTVALVSAALGAPLRAATITDLALAQPQPAAGASSPGLSVRYYFSLFRDIEELISWQKYEKGKPGAALSALNYRSGEGNVLTSNIDDGVGAHIKGMIYLEDPGLYAFATQSNDGVRVSLGGKMIIDDPDVHADRYSDPVEVEIKSAGWYPIEVLYFERKVTSTLQLFWLLPDEEEGSMAVVPAEYFAHMK